MSLHQVRVLSVIYSASSLAIFWYFGRPGRPSPEARHVPKFILYLILHGTLIRLILAGYTQGNYDTVSWQVAVDRFREGVDPYAGNARYNYSPLWYWVLGLLSGVQQVLPKLHLHFVVGTFLTLVDLASLFVLTKIASIKKAPLYAPALFFYFNPISYLLTGYHCQIDNFAIFFVILGYWLYLKRRTGGGHFWLWAGATAGLLIKQLAILHLLAAFNAGFKKLNQRLLLFAASITVFILFLWPYWAAGKEDILKNVLFYTPSPEPYGLATFFVWPAYKWLLLAGLLGLAWVVRHRPLLNQAALLSLFFLAMTPAVAVQYFVLPVAVSALRPSLGLLIYTTATTLFLLGNYYNMHFQPLSWVPWNAVWLSTIVWFVHLYKNPSWLDGDA